MFVCSKSGQWVLVLEKQEGKGVEESLKLGVESESQVWEVPEHLGSRRRVLRSWARVSWVFNVWLGRVWSQVRGLG